MVGILAALLLQPARSMDGERWARWYWRWFFRALGPLSVLLLLSLQQRVTQYGVTESRYLGFVIGGWLLAVSAYFTLRPAGSTRSIPASLAALCLLSVVGPWSAFSVSLASQQRQLLSVLEPFGAVENGRLVPARRALPTKELASARSILNHLLGTYEHAGLRELLAGFDASPTAAGRQGLKRDNAWVNAESVISYISSKSGVEGNLGPNPNGSIWVSVDLDLSGGLPVDGYRALYHGQFYSGKKAQKIGDLAVEFLAGINPPRITYAGAPVDTTALEARLASIAEAGAKAKHRLPPSEMSARLVSGSREWLVVVSKLQARRRAADRPILFELDIYLLQK